MAEPVENLLEKRPRCKARRAEVEERKKESVPSATARYACGSVYSVFDDSRQGPFCVGLC